jgi:hypothetical protein
MSPSRRAGAQGSDSSIPELPPSTPVMNDSGDSETTGRYIVIFKEHAVENPAVAKQALNNLAGIANVAVAADYESSAVCISTHSVLRWCLVKAQRCNH